MATETQETVVDIIADWRDLAEHRDWNNHTRQSNRERVSDIADRLEAAHKRELSKMCPKTGGDFGQLGDCAKLREALVYLIQNESTLFEANLTGGELELLHLITNKARAALAAPPRNCDRFGGDIDKLREACARERGLNPEEDFPDVFPDWLLAPATEKEGGNDGNK